MGAALQTLAAVAALTANPAAGVQHPQGGMRTLQATSEQMLALAEEMVRRGNQDDAHAILDLLTRDPDRNVRNEARYRLAVLLKAAGHPESAAVLLRRILDEKPDATPVRIELAQLLERLGDNDAAWRELRAAQAAGLPAAVARMVDRYSDALQALRPLGASFEIALAPDSNINHATRSGTLGTIFGDFDIDRDSKAKSGLGVSMRAQAFKRFALRNGGNSVLVRANAFGDFYGKSDFNVIGLDLAIGPELRVRSSNRLNVELGATQRWYGQQPFVRSMRAALAWLRPLGSRTQLRLNTSASILDNQFNDLQDGRSYTGQVSVEHALSTTAGGAVSFGLDRESLRDPGYSTTGWRASLLGWKSIGRATLTANAELGRRHADERLLLFPDERRDRYSRMTLGATFRQMTFKGFAPVTRFTIERNRSTIEFYGYKRTRAELALVRAF